jgi:hypothetical protein
MSRVPRHDLEAWGREHRIASLATDPQVAEGAAIAKAILPSLQAAPEADDDDGQPTDDHEADEAAHGPPLGRGEACPPHLLAIPGVLQQAVDYFNATARSPQPQFAVLAALAFGAVILGRRWCTANRNFASFYGIAVARTGSGKEHVKTVVQKFLVHAGLSRLVGPSGYTSASGVVSTLFSKPCHLCVVDEFGRVLGGARSSGMQHRNDALTKLMEVWGRQDGFMEQTGYSMFGAKIEIKKEAERVMWRPSITLLGLTTPSTFTEALDGGDIASGFLNRFLVVLSNEPRSKRRILQGEVPLPDDVLQWAREHASAHSEAGNLSNVDSAEQPPDPVVVPISEQWGAAFEAFGAEVEALQDQSPVLDEMLARLVEMAMRLSLIVARSSGETEISEASARWAIDYVRHHSFRLLDVVVPEIGRSKFGKLVSMVAEAIKRAGSKGLTDRELGRQVGAMTNVSKNQSDQVLDAVRRDHPVELRTLPGKRGRARVAHVWLG